MGRRRDYDNEPDDADELIAEDRHRRIHKHRDGDPECECLECNNENEGDEDE